MGRAGRCEAFAAQSAAGGAGGVAPLRRRCVPFAGMAVAVALLPAPAPAQMDEALVAGQVVTVRVYKDDRQAAQGAGVVANAEGVVLTSAAVLDAGARVSVAAQGSGELAAEVRLKEKGSGLGVLMVDGLQRPGLPLSVAEVAPGGTVYSATPTGEAGQDAFKRGAVSTTEARTVRGVGEVRLLQHNAMIDAHAYGSPVVDECGRVVALNVPDPGAWSILTPAHRRQPEEVVFALSANDVAARLEGLGVAFTAEAGTCASAEERAHEAQQERQRAEHEARQAQEAQRQAEALKEELEAKARQAQEDQAASEQERQAARAAAEEAARKAEAAARKAAEASAHAEEMRRARDAAEQEAAEAVRRAAEARAREARLRHIALLGGAGGAALLLLILGFWAMSARRKRRAVRSAQARAAEAEREAAQAGRDAAQAEEEAAQARQRIAELPEPAPFDCVLSGTDGSGAPYALNLRREALGDPAGVVIGRDPAVSSHIIADPSVSRRHVRLYVDGGVLHAQDLESTNGTFINGRTLVPGEAVRADTGDLLEIGSLAFRIDLQT